MDNDAELDSTVESSEHDIVKSSGQEVIGLFLAPQQVFSSSSDSNDFHSGHNNGVTVLTDTGNLDTAAEPSSLNTSGADVMLDDDTSENPLDSNHVSNDYSNSDHHDNLTANDLVSSTVAVVTSDPGTVYLDQSGVALAELLPGSVSLPPSGSGEATFVHHANGGNVVIATESASYDGIAMATISHTSPTDQQIAALSQFTSNMDTQHVTNHDHHATLYVLEDPSHEHHHDSGSLIKKSFPCAVVGCSKQFSTPYRLKAHIRSHTGDMFECDSQGCDKAFITQSDLNKHIKTHSGMKPFQCQHNGCGKVYTTAHHLKVHERSHSGEKPYKCTYPHCNKAFATGYGLKSHTRTHTGEKPYSCPEPQCNKAFKTSGDLQKHIRTHTGERPFKCLYESCNRSFTTSNIRKVHMRTHTGERPYVCEYEGCKKSFASATNYKNHTRIHTGERPYVCQVDGCKKSFTEYSSLYKHHVVHTHNKPYTCNICDKTYRQASTLALHKRTTHGDLSGVTMADGHETYVSSSDDPDLKRPRLEFTSTDNGRTYSMVMSSDDTSAVAAMQAINSSLSDMSDVTTGHITIPVTITTDSQLQGVPVVITETPPSNIMQEPGNENDMTSQSVSLVTSGYSSVSRFISTDNVAYVYATIGTEGDDTQTEVSSSTDIDANFDASDSKQAYQEITQTIDTVDSAIKIVKSVKQNEIPESIREQVLSANFHEDETDTSHDSIDKHDRLNDSIVSSTITEISVGNML
ncbi:zinc finger protein 143-like isoform X2 [Xenia sp. Carnegie-2017]|nr:zinc finger protein 143-like isoform X2 [Xenia sp. Carnegie-2017]